MVGAVRFGQRRLPLRSDRADDGRPERLAPLAQEQADAARGGMHQDRVARHDLVGLPQEVLRRQALQHDDRADLVRNRVRQANEFAGIDIALGRIGADRHAVGDAIARLESGDALADRDHIP